MTSTCPSERPQASTHAGARRALGSIALAVQRTALRRADVPTHGSGETTRVRRGTASWSTSRRQRSGMHRTTPIDGNPRCLSEVVRVGCGWKCSTGPRRAYTNLLHAWDLESGSSLRHRAIVGGWCFGGSARLAASVEDYAVLVLQSSSTTRLQRSASHQSRRDRPLLHASTPRRGHGPLNSPEIIAQGTDWRFLTEPQKELKG
jgi:hypothetical protein